MAGLAGLVAAWPAASADIGQAAPPVLADAGAAMEGGEAGKAWLAEAAVAEDGYPLRLALMAAHLRIGAAIDATGDRAAALEHVANPHHVFFDVPGVEMAAAGDAGFDAELGQTLAMMGSGVPSEDVAPLFAVMQERMRAAATEKSTGARLDVAMQLLRTAAAEYDFALKDGARGVRFAVVGRVQSRVRDAGQREILFDLDCSIAQLREGGSVDLLDRLAKTRSKLLRMWAGA